MIMQLKNTLGVYRPLDVFEDFKIDYNHQYEDYKEIGGKRMPYTSSFKIPLTSNNRDLCGVPFDATYPLSHSVDGRMLYNDLTVAFYFIADIEGQTIKDRKSTRLNSSHRCISYAVFCLKKKKQQKQKKKKRESMV